MTKDGSVHRLVEWLLNTSVVEDVTERNHARAKVFNYGARVIEHAYKVLRWPEHTAHYHWAHELATLLIEVRDYKDRPVKALDWEDAAQLLLSRSQLASRNLEKAANRMRLDGRAEGQRLLDSMALLTLFVEDCCALLHSQGDIRASDVQQVAVSHLL